MLIKLYKRQKTYIMSFEGQLRVAQKESAYNMIAGGEFKSKKNQNYRKVVILNLSRIYQTIDSIERIQTHSSKWVIISQPVQ